MPNYFYNTMKQTHEEKQVEGIFNNALKKAFLKPNEIITNPYKCDGLIIADNIKLLVEYKFNVNLKDALERAKVLIQVVFYLKKFQENGDTPPNVIMIADRNEVFVLHYNSLVKYLDEEVDWAVSPSTAHHKYNDITRKIALDNDINPFVYNIDNSFNFDEIEKRIRNLANGVKQLVKVSEHNLSRSYNYFCENVIKDADKIPTNDLVGIFIKRITDKENCFKHPDKENTLVCGHNEYKIDGKAFDAFFSTFDKEYSVTEKKALTEIADRLIEDTNRRRKGEFYTPTIFADQAHKMLSSELGDDWKEKFVVWDCCWGTGNLTRDYKFKELYCSTLEQAELDCGSRYNPEATKFQLDFLNDDIVQPSLFGYKIPENLYKALTDKKPLVFLINHPFATAYNMKKGEDAGQGKDSCKTKTSSEMTKNNMGNANKNLLAQFLYNIALITRHFGLKDVVIGLFSNPIFMSGSSYKNFRQLFLANFTMKDAILFKSSYFSDVSDRFGISFSIWRSEPSTSTKDFYHIMVDIIDDHVSPIGQKNIYNLDNEESAKDWIKEPLYNLQLEKRPPLSTGIKVKVGKNSNTKIDINAIGCYLNVGNDVHNSAVFVSLFTSCDNSNANGLSVTLKNFDRVCAMFAARKLIPDYWYNNKDQYLKPIENECFVNFTNDAIVFSLFHIHSNQSSLREVAFEDKLWDIKNEFFYMSKNEIIELADKEGYDFTYTDAQSSQERFVYKKLQDISLSDEAQDVLDYAIKLTKDSFKYRKEWNERHPEYQIMNWDCGWYQLKFMLKEYMPEEMKIFSEKFKRLADKMRPMVYELGFLK